MRIERFAKHWLALSIATITSASCSGSGSAAGSTDGSAATSDQGGTSSNAPAAGTRASSSVAPAAAGSGGRIATSAGASATSQPSAAPAAGSGGVGASTSTAPANAGAPASAGRSGAHAAAGSGNAGSAGSAGSDSSATLEKFSFFVTSLAGLQRLAKGQDGFGGDLRYGQADGLSGADKICSELAESSMPGSAAKGWHAFLSVASGPDSKPVNAIDRVGEGPWYDRLGRVLALNKAALVNERPKGADPTIIDDLPNEDGVPNKQPDPGMDPVNNHHFLTGSDTAGKLYMGSATSTCKDWTSKDQSAGRPRVGFSYPAGNRQNWLSGQDEGGCGAGKVLVDMGGSDPSNPIVGSGGGYGGFYCFALTP